jgi:hypothetical protein
MRVAASCSVNEIGGALQNVTRFEAAKGAFGSNRTG